MTTFSSKFDLEQEVFAARPDGGVTSFRIGAISARVATPEARKGADWTTGPTIYYEILPNPHGLHTYRLHDERDVFSTEEEAKAHAAALKERHEARLATR